MRQNELTASKITKRHLLIYLLLSPSPARNRLHQYASHPAFLVCSSSRLSSATSVRKTRLLRNRSYRVQGAGNVRGEDGCRDRDDSEWRSGSEVELTC